MDQFRVRWTDTVNTGDDVEIAYNALECARDEGPIMLLPWRTTKRPMPSRSHGCGVLVFKDAATLAGFMILHGKTFNQEVWLGICESVTREQRERAETAMWYFAKLLTDSVVGNRSSLKPSKALKEEAALAALSANHALLSPPLSCVEAVIEHCGEAFEDVAFAYANLPASVLISRGQTSQSTS